MSEFRMSAEEPYGDLITTTVSIATWNVWGQYGPWREREDGIVEELLAASPDVVALQESWVSQAGESQASRLAARLGYEHFYAGPTSLQLGGWSPVGAVLSRWPLESIEHVALTLDAAHRGWPGELITCLIAGPRGTIPLVNVSLDWPPQASALRQVSVRQVATLAKQKRSTSGFPVVVCGDFNASPESAELRMLTGLDDTALPGFVLFDAWDKSDDPSANGTTWDRKNPWAAPTLLPSRRIDYILTGWPSTTGGAGDVVAVRRLGVSSGDVAPPSDHYGVIATLRY